MDGQTGSESEVIIVGGGPAGISTALHLLQLDPGWRERILVLEKARYPREKLCGGGITRFGLSLLEDLGLEIGVPSVEVNTVHFLFDEFDLQVDNEPMFRVVRRAEFDAWLADCATQRGVRIHQEEAVVGVTVNAQDVRVESSAAAYRGRVLVGADGSKGVVRRLAGFKRKGKVGRLLEVVTPESLQEREFAEHYATMEFSQAGARLQGYTWDFPSLIGGERYLNRGAYDAHHQLNRPPAKLPRALEAHMAARDRDLSAVELQGHPLRLFSPRAEFSRPRVLLVGDAAGADPFFGEGIAMALAYGKLAALEIATAFESNDFRFKGYRRRVLGSHLGSTLLIRKVAAKLLYRDIRRGGWLTFFHAVSLLAPLLNLILKRGKYKVHRLQRRDQRRTG